MLTADALAICQAAAPDLPWEAKTAQTKVVTAVTAQGPHGLVRYTHHRTVVRHKAFRAEFEGPMTPWVARAAALLVNLEPPEE